VATSLSLPIIVKHRLGFRISIAPNFGFNRYHMRFSESLVSDQITPILNYLRHSLRHIIMRPLRAFIATRALCPKTILIFDLQQVPPCLMVESVY